LNSFQLIDYCPDFSIYNDSYSVTAYPFMEIPDYVPHTMPLREFARDLLFPESRVQFPQLFYPLRIVIIASTEMLYAIAKPSLTRLEPLLISIASSLVKGTSRMLSRHTEVKAKETTASAIIILSKLPFKFSPKYKYKTIE